MTVLTVGGDDPVACLEHGNDADCDRFLAIIEMQKAADLFLGIELGANTFKMADADHLPQQFQRMRPR